jgi:hypothetical protein
MKLGEYWDLFHDFWTINEFDTNSGSLNWISSVSGNGKWIKN